MPSILDDVGYIARRQREIAIAEGRERPKVDEPEIPYPNEAKCNTPVQFGRIPWNTAPHAVKVGFEKIKRKLDSYQGYFQHPTVGVQQGVIKDAQHLLDNIVTNLRLRNIDGTILSGRVLTVDDRIGGNMCVEFLLEDLDGTIYHTPEYFLNFRNIP